MKKIYLLVALALSTSVFAKDFTSSNADCVQAAINATTKCANWGISSGNYDESYVTTQKIQVLEGIAKGENKPTCSVTISCEYHSGWVQLEGNH